MHIYIMELPYLEDTTGLNDVVTHGSWELKRKLETKGKRKKIDAYIYENIILKVGKQQSIIAYWEPSWFSIREDMFICSMNVLLGHTST